jgi:hypothetical protein
MTPFTSLFFNWERSAIWLISSDFVMSFDISIHPDSTYRQYLQIGPETRHDGNVHRFVATASAPVTARIETKSPKYRENGGPIWSMNPRLGPY